MPDHRLDPGTPAELLSGLPLLVVALPRRVAVVRIAMKRQRAHYQAAFRLDDRALVPELIIDNL